jgi:RimJ/RimL family protein N-acetyltransferase
MEVPTLTTDRLTLRGWRADDLDAYAAIAADPEVMRFMGGPLDRYGHVAADGRCSPGTGCCAATACGWSSGTAS